MSFKSPRMGLILAAALTVAVSGVALAGEKASVANDNEFVSAQASADGYRTASRLGGSRSLYAACRPAYDPNCLAKPAAVKKMAASKAFQKSQPSSLSPGASSLLPGGMGGSRFGKTSGGCGLGIL